MVENYPGNSKTPKDTPRPKKVVQGKIVERRQSLGSKIRETFGGETAPSIGEFVLFDIVIPSIRDLIYEIVVGGAGRALGKIGSGRRALHTAKTSSGNYIPYESFSRDKKDSKSLVPVTKPDPKTGVKQYVLESRVDAEMAIDALVERWREYEFVTVADLYDVYGVTPDWPDHQFGWDDIRGIKADRVPEGYVIDLPTPKRRPE